MGKDSTEEACLQPSPADPEWAAPDPCCLSLGHQVCLPVRQWLLQKGGLGSEMGTPPPWLQPYKAAGPDGQGHLPGLCLGTGR